MLRLMGQVLCACGCGEPVVRSGKSGPAPIYASKACRMRALRHRRATAEMVPVDMEHVAHVGIASKPVQQQIERGLLEARAIGFAFQRLGTVARPDMAWRCDRLGKAIIAAIQDTFGKDTV